MQVENVIARMSCNFISVDWRGSSAWPLYGVMMICADITQLSPGSLHASKPEKPYTDPKKAIGIRRAWIEGFAS